MQLTIFKVGGVRDKITGNTFVKNLPSETKSKDLYQFFSEFGKVFSCRVKYNPNKQCKGYGYVQFDSKETAEKVLAQANGKDFKGAKIEINPFKAREGRNTSLTKYNNLFVKCIPKKFTNDDMNKLFKSFGEIISAVVIKDTADATENKGFGFVCFKNTEDAKNAEEKMKNFALEGQTLYVCRALSKEDHKRQMREERLKAFKDCNLYVKELPDDVNDEKLKQTFEEFGKVLSARVMLETKQDLATGKIEKKSRNFGFVCFSNKEEAKKAMTEAPARQIFGRTLYIAIAEKKEDRIARVSNPLFMPYPGMHPGAMYFGPQPYGFQPPYPHRPRKPRFVYKLLCTLIRTLEEEGLQEECIHQLECLQ